MRKLLLFLFAFFLIFESIGQFLEPSTIATSGNGTKGKEVYLEWVIGADKISPGIIVTEIKKNEEVQMEISVFPNPVYQFVNLHFKSSVGQNYLIKVFDVRGKELLSEKISEPLIKIDFQSFASGFYIIKVLNPSLEPISVFKIEKLN